MRFAINHISAAKAPPAEFFAMARRLGTSEVEMRNDTPDTVGHADPADLRAEADAQGITLLSINALYPFNRWDAEVEARAIRLADYAQAAGVQALVLCPLNDGHDVPPGDTVAALRALAPILRGRRLLGLVEPLGFPSSSLRLKSDAVAAIRAAGGEDVFKLLHDTFHHHLAGETKVFADETALVHISGLTDPGVAVADMLDAHRVLVDGDDRLENLTQIRALLAAGYDGPFSFEPFAAELREAADPEPALRASIEHIRAHL